LAQEAEIARELLVSIASSDEEQNHDMVEGETGLLEAIDTALDAIDDCEVTVAGCDEKIRQLTDRRDRAKRRIETVRALIEQAMARADMQTIKRPTATLTVKHLPPKPIYDDEAAIPSRFWRVPDPVLDRKAINAAFKDGETIPGVTASNGGISLTIRRT